MVGVEFQTDAWPAKETLAELGRLAETAGAQVVGELIQKRDSPDPAFFIGKGKAQEIKDLAIHQKANLIIIDHEISPSQNRNLEELTGLKIIDRTELILDIFAQHALSREGKIQVEMAQSQYHMSRLTGKGITMSRLGGGIGTRGPGETKLEVDRRKIRKRISDLKEELRKLEKQRSLRRQQRKEGKSKVAALIGYTNAGKSTLLNALTNANVLVQDKLFATLDPTTRRLEIRTLNTEHGTQVSLRAQRSNLFLLTDTVGFIQKLPHQLVDAFHATLEEVKEADLLIHVVDASNPYLEKQIEAVYQVLEEIGCITKKMITVFNKVDKIEKLDKHLLKKYDPAVAISAAKKQGLEKLIAYLWSHGMP